MSQKFHINAKGVPAPCRATKGNCPFGGAESHFDTVEAAQVEADRRNELEFNTIPTVNHLTEVQMPKDEFESFKSRLRDQDKYEMDFVPRQYELLGPEYYDISEDYESTDDYKSREAVRKYVPEEFHDDFLIESKEVAMTDEKGVNEIFDEMYNRENYNSVDKYKYIEQTPNELAKIKSEILNNPELKINGEPIYKVEYLTTSKYQIDRNFEASSDMISENPEGKKIQIALDFNIEADNLRKDIQDKYAEVGTGVPPLTREEQEYMDNEGYAPEEEKINEYIQLKNDVLYGGTGPSPAGTYTYADEEREYGDNTPESIAIANKLDERYFATKKMIDEIYDKEIYSKADDWDELDYVSKIEWDDLDEMKLSKRDSQYMAAKVIFRDFPARFMK